MCSKASVYGWVIRVGNACRDCIAQEFRSIEVIVAVIIACDDLTANGVAGPFQKSAVPLVT
jgi:hypothetical protein